jgi:hypothetical protein
MSVFQYSFCFLPSGHPDLFNYAQISVFNVKYLGHLKNVSPQSGRLSSAENQTVTLEAIDTAQVQITPSNSPNGKVIMINKIIARVQVSSTMITNAFFVSCTLAPRSVAVGDQ